MIQREVKDIKGNYNSHCIRHSLRSFNEGRPAGLPDIHDLVKKNSSEYLHEFNYDDFGLVKKECCADDRNTYCVCFNVFFERASILYIIWGMFI